MPFSLYGHRFDVTTILYEFDTSDGSGWQYAPPQRVLTYSFSDNSSELFRQIYSEAFQELSAFLNFSFVRVADEAELTGSWQPRPGPDTLADLRLSQQSTSGVGGNAAMYAWDTDYDEDQEDLDSINRIWSVNHETILHELGHALSLRHTSPNQAPSEPPYLPSEYQNHNYTVMHYYLEGPSNNFDPATGEWAYRHFQLFDVYALQLRFGANMSTYAGNDVHTASSLQANQWLKVLWDAGGSDTIDMSAETRPQIIDLRDGQFSNVGTVAGNNPSGYNLAVAIGASIEDARGGAGADTITGNNGDNVLTGNGGDDRISGGGGVDTAVFSGSRAGYSLVNLGAAGIRVTGADGSDTVTGVERLQFADGTFTVPTALFEQSMTQVSEAFGSDQNAGGWTSADEFPRTMADINGDGRADIVGFGGAGTFVSLGQAGGAFGPIVQVSGEFGQAPAAGGWASSDRNPRLLGDVNGDGLADIVGFGEAGAYVALAHGSGGFGAISLATSDFGAAASAGGWESQNLHQRTLADVNGDGRVDIIGFGDAGTYVALGQANGTFGAMNQVSTEFGRSPAAGGWTTHDLYPRMLADVNGDGRADIVGFGESATYVAYADASGTFGAMSILTGTFGAAPDAGGWASQDLYPRLLADVNGDGLADIIGFGESGTYYALNGGAAGFGSTELGFNNFGAGAGAGGWTSSELFPRMLADVNGDGLADLVGFGETGVYVTLADSFDLLISGEEANAGEMFEAEAGANFGDGVGSVQFVMLNPEQMHIGSDTFMV